jgi:putative ABC transport system substrate-binding protein
MRIGLRRREFIAGVSGAAAWPVLASAQQRAMPVVGYFELGRPEQKGNLLVAFRKGLSETGYVDGRNVAFEYRWANDQYDRLPDLAADLVLRRPTVIAAAGGLSVAMVTKAATETIPIVFRTGTDPVQAGLVASLNRPGGNVTGITSMDAELMSKRLGLLHELLPGATRFAVLVDPTAYRISEYALYKSIITELQGATSSIGRHLEVLNASSSAEIDIAFAAMVEKRVEAVLANPTNFLNSRRTQIVTNTVFHRLPVIYSAREWVETGGLMSYGTRDTDIYRLAGIYTGRIPKGDKPADLPVMQPTRFEFVINLQTAKLLSIEVPPTLLALADEVIE